MIRVYANELMTAVFDGYGKKIENIAYNSPDDKMIKAIEENVYHFSAAKNYHQIKDLTHALLDDDKRIRSFNDFRKACEKINKNYIERWMETEYNLAIAGSQMSSKWVDIKKNAKTLPFLRYETANDARVRDSHKSLNKVVKKVNDEFWNTYYPPNGWGCRCTVVQLANAVETPDDKIATPEMPELFKGNWSSEGIIYPHGHAYWNGVPNDILEKGKSLVEPKWAKIYDTKKGGEIIIHKSHGGNEKKENIETAKFFANAGKKVKLQPNPSTKTSYDATINDEKWEFKLSCGSKSSINSRIENAQNQSTNIVIRFSKSISLIDIKRHLKGTVNQKKWVENVIIIADNKLHNKWSRKEILMF